MDLILTVIRYQQLPPAQASRAKIGEAGGTIGRRWDNDLTLPDEERWVSGQHARIQFRGGAFHLMDTSKNGTFVNQSPEPLTQGQEVRLREGDKLGIGAYEILVSLESEKPQPAAPFDPFVGAEPESEPFSELTPGETAPDILDLVGSMPARQEPVLPTTTQEEGGSSAPGAWRMDESEAEEPWILGGEEIPDSGPSRTEPDHTPDERAFFSPPNAIPEGYDIWTDEGGGVPEIRETEPREPEPSTSAAPQRAPDPETPAPPEPSTLAPTPGIAPTPATQEESEIVRAFLSGLGCGELPLDPAVREEVMSRGGLLLRAMTEGLMRVLMARASFKSDLRLEMTTIRSAGNNPFKFSVDPEDALRHLLFQPSRGFLPAEKAAHEAFDDIQRHEMAIIAGLRAALRALLARLDPAQLEQRFRDRSMLDNLMPMALKAKYWDLFSESYGEVAADAEDDFLRLFGDAFTHAYEQQTEQLKKSGGAGPQRDG